MVDGLGDCFIRICIMPHRFPRGLELLSMPTRGGIVSTSISGRGQKGGQKGAGAKRPRPECPVDLFSEEEFRARFYIPNDISILLVDDEPMTTEKLSHNATYFSNEQFNIGFYFPLSSLLKQFFHFTKIPRVFLHPNVVRVLMGCSILDMLYHLNLSLMEVIFIYMIKMIQKEV